MKHLQLYLFFINLCSVTFAASFDPSKSSTYYFTANSTASDQYALFIMAQSSFTTNLFQYSSPSSDFTNFVTALDIVKTNLSISLFFPNTWTQQDADSISQDTTQCVNQTNYNCITSNSISGICNLLAPTPNHEGLLNISSQLVNCTTVSANPLCDFTLTNFNLTDMNGNIILSSADTLCPQQDIEIIVTVEVYKAYIPAMTNLVGSGSLTFHYLGLLPSSQLTTSVSTSRIELPSKISQNTNLQTYSDDSYLARSDIKTVIQTKLVRHDYPSDIYCQYQVNYTGLIRGIYVNDYPSSNHMPREYDLDSQSSVQSSLYFQLKANQTNLINIIGLRLNGNTTIQFNNCRDKWKTGGNSVQPVFSDFIFGQVALESQDYPLISNSISCPSSCKQCTYSGICTRCSPFKFLAYGNCQTFCPQGISIPDYKQICNTILESPTVFIGNPEINQDNIVINYYDDLGGDQVIVLHAKNQITLNNAPIAWPSQLSLLPESIIIFAETQQGVHQIFVPIPSLANSSFLSSYSPPNNTMNTTDYPADSITPITNKIFAVHYPLSPSTNYFLAIYWNYQKSFENLTLAQQRSPDSTFLLKNRRYQYLSTLGFYIFQAFVQCNAECEIQVTSDGTVQLYKNDQVLLFDLTFKSRWTYTYTQKLTGSIYLKFIVKNANYFQPFISADDFQLYAPQNPTSIHAIGPLPLDQHACNIPNCLSCQDTICFSCDNGYFLTLDQSECVQECPAGSYYSSTERTCEESCDISQTQNPTRNECLPICEEPGYYFTPDVGCQVCVPDCKVCYDATTCSQCEIDSNFNTPTFCFRKTGTLFDLQNFTLNQTVTLQRDSSADLALVVTDSSSFGNFTFYFYDQPRKIPRILKTLKMKRTGNMSTATIPPLDISEPGYISIHYLRIQDLPGFSSTGFRVIPYKDWPLYQSVPQIDSATGPIVYNSTINDDQGLTKLESEYETLVASRVYEHDQTSPFTCRLQITYYGDMRGVYANGELIFAHSTSGSNFITKLSQSFTIYPAEMILMTFVGHEIQIQNASFTECINTNKAQIIPNWTSYLLQGAGADHDDFYISENTTFCADHCKSCSNEFQCLACENAYYLNDGLCLPKCSNSSSIQLLYGLCQNEERSQGYLSYYYYSSLNSILTVEFDIILEMDLQLLITAHPFSVVSTSHATFAFLPSGKNPSLASGVYQVQNYFQNQTELDISLNLKSVVSNSNGGGSTDLIISTIRNDKILFYYFNSQPTTLAQLSQAQDFQYISMDNQPSSLDVSKIYYWDFFFNCTSQQCQLKIQGTGNVEITQDERTLAFSAYLDESFGVVTLSRTFSGLGHLVIKVWNATSFHFDLLQAMVFAQGDLVSHNTISAISYQPTQASSRCLNGYKTKCFSCKTGYFLDLSTGLCSTTCPSTTYGLLTERVCIPSTSCISPLIARDEFLCTMNCTNYPGFYYLPDTAGCTNQCNQTCQTCSGPSSANCLSCTYPRFLQSNGTCSCPIGTQDGPQGTCESISWINITSDVSNVFCSNINLTANIRIDELTSYNITFRWSLTGQNTMLKNYLATQLSQSIQIPGIYLDNNSTYNFTVSYQNAANKTIQAWKFIIVSYSVLPNISFQNGNSQTISNYLESLFLVQFDDTAICSSLLVNPTWTVLSGPVVNIGYDATLPLKMTLPGCSLSPSNSSVLKLRLSLRSNSSIYVEQTLTIQTLPERFETTILTNTQNYPENADLFLDGALIYLDKCNLRASGKPQYSWSCINLTQSAPGAPCIDQNGIFSLSRFTSPLTVPKIYYKQGNQLLFTLSIEKNSLIQNSSISIFIQDSTTLITQISCSNPIPDCLKYTPSKQYLIYGNIQAAKLGLPTNLTSAELERLNQTWTVSPTVPFAYFGNTFKLFSGDTSSLPNNIDFLTITFMVENATHKGTSSINLPINRAPIPGALIATPSSGSSLSTNFVLTANQWQDIDIPLTYRFYYSAADSTTSPMPLRSDYSTDPQLTTILPSGDLKVTISVKDYFGAETTLNTQVQVTFLQSNLQQAINTYNQLLSQATSPFETTQIIAMISSEIGQWESQLSQNAPEPVCPSCSNHGYCPKNQARCVCETGWAVIDCAIRQSDVDEIVDLKQTLLQDLINSYISMLQNTSTTSLSTSQDMIYQILENFLQDQHFNTNSSLLLVQNILNGTLDIFNPNTILTSSQIASVSEILSDMMGFSQTYDCSGATNFTKNLLSKTQQYLQKIAQSSLADQITNQNATIIDTQNIDMYLQKLSMCSLNNKIISAGSSSPQITITLGSDVAENCSYVVNLEYYAFNDNLLNCSSEISSNSSKSALGIQVTDPNTGQKSQVNMSVSINYGKDISKCPSSCTIFPGNICKCDDLSPFDVGKQLLKVFADSNILYIQKIASLLTFKFWETASFWMIFLLTSWFIFTLVVIRYKLRKYDVMLRIRQFTQLPKMTCVWMTLQVGHHLVAIYLVPNQEKLSKSARALFFYTRTLLLLSFSSIFSGPARDEDNYKYEGFEWNFNFNVYLFLLPYLTIHPVLFIIKRLIIEPKETSSNMKKSFATKLLCFMRTRLPIWFVVFVIFGNFILIFIINSNQTPVQRLAWTIDFIQSMLQDLVLTPLLFMLSQYYLFKIHSNHKFAKKFPRIHQKLIPKILEESLVEIFAKISPPKLKRSNKIAPAPTKTLMKSSPDIDSLSAISDSPNNDSLNLEKLLRSPSNRFDLFKSSNFVGPTNVIKEEALEESPSLPKPSTLLCLESPNNEELQKQNINISKLFESVDLDFAYKNPRTLKFQSSLLQLQDLNSQNNTPKENKARGIKKLYLPDFSPKTDIIAQSKDFSDASNLLLTQQQTPKDKDDELLLNFKKLTSEKDTSPASLFMKRESSALQYQSSTERSDKTLLGGLGKAEEESKLFSTLKSPQSPDAQNLQIGAALLDRPTYQKLKRLNSETESVKSKISTKPKKLNRATTGFKSDVFNRLIKSTTMPMQLEDGASKNNDQLKGESISNFSDQMTIKDLENE